MLYAQGSSRNHGTVLTILYAGMGFCDYNIFISSERGGYNWTETEVGNETVRLGCVFGRQDLSDSDAMAERMCVDNLVWSAFNGGACASRATAELRMIGNVSS